MLRLWRAATPSPVNLVQNKKALSLLSLTNPLMPIFSLSEHGASEGNPRSFCSQEPF